MYDLFWDGYPKSLLRRPWPVVNQVGDEEYLHHDIMILVYCESNEVIVWNVKFWLYSKTEPHLQWHLIFWNWSWMRGYECAPASIPNSEWNNNVVLSSFYYFSSWYQFMLICRKTVFLKTQNIDYNLLV